MKPVIGMTCNMKDGYYRVPVSYAEAVERAGGVPLVIAPGAGREAQLRQLDSCDGVIFIGGPDIHATNYGLEDAPSMTSCLTPWFEDRLMDFARVAIQEMSLPVLGICLGHQVINVACGGTLIRDIPSECPGSVEHRRVQDDVETMHGVTLLADGGLTELFGTAEMDVNSSHHQAVDMVGEGLKLAARACDGTVEAIVGEGYPQRFLVGLQWHPERLQDDPLQRKSFAELIRRAAEEKR